MSVSNALSLSDENDILSAIERTYLYTLDSVSIGTHDIYYSGYAENVYFENYEIIDVVSGKLIIY